MRYAVLAVFLIVVLAPTSQAQDAGIEFFERKIRPILVEHCYECHATTAKKVRGQLLLDSRDGVKRGGVNGSVIVANDPAKSPLILAVRHVGETKMPPKSKLSATQIADLEAWVRMGAPDPRDKAPKTLVAKSWDDVVRERRKWWSLQPVKKPGVPTPKGAAWSSDAIDRFLLAVIEAKGLTPARDADARTLVRRLSLVLTGLPPTRAESDEFAKAWDAPDAKRKRVLEDAVDRLLASPHFGERWARHWMDVVRFTETHGNEWNYDVHHAWRYRDYLIRAFNDDVPYDQLVREHIAGDLLPKPRWNAKERFNESIIGSAFYRFGEVNHDDCIGLPSIGYDLVDNQIDTLSKAFQAMTIACARCHDHKLDAISMRDYHGLLGILRSSRQVAHTIDAPEVNAETMRKMRELQHTIRHELATMWLKEIEPAALEKAVMGLKEDKLAMEDPLTPWRRVLKKQPDASFADTWKQIVTQYRQERDERKKLHDTNFVTLADFRFGEWPEWQFGGQGLRGEPSRNGELIVAREGERAIAAILPAGAFTHALSEKLNGTIRSPVLTTNKKYISLQVLGERASAVRLVSNNCQLNYRNYRYLTKNELHWVTFPIPENAESLRVYVELMTKLDNPKFPDQLGTLGGDKVNYRIPWEQAAADPRSHFGVTQVVLHDQPDPPRESLAHLDQVLSAPPNREKVAQFYFILMREAILRWQNGEAKERDAIWLNAFVQRGILSNRALMSPKLSGLTAEYRALEAKLELPRIVPGLADFGPGFEQPIFTRGDCMKPGEKTPRRFVEVLSRDPIMSAGSGRLELANQIASRDNPLTARVMVNRVWHHLFGTGLVRTVDDFGHVGELPSHPELLDHLAIRFVDDGWSIKKLIRAIVLTHAFRLSHTPDAAMLESDPENRSLARYPARRMEAEAIRDSILFASGRLDRTLFGPSINAYREKEYADRRLFKGPLDGNGRRSVYIRVTLMEPPKFLEVFNFPGSKVCQGRRDVTDTPAQALTMLNDPFVHQQADVWAKRLAGHKSVDRRFDELFRTALGRPPRVEERERFARFVTRVAMTQNVAPEHASVWRDAAHAMFNVQEFITIP